MYLQINVELSFGDVEIDEMEYYLRDVNIVCREKHLALFRMGHVLIHRMEAIRRFFALNETFHLGFNPDMLYAIANWHDAGKYIASFSSCGKIYGR